jgi:hexosaminidase
LDAVVDLEQAVEMKRVRFHALTNKGAWIYNPSQVKVLVSDDGENFREVGGKEYPISTWADRDGIFAYELELEPLTTRYVEVVIEGRDLPEDHSGYGNPAWLFVDEIEIE